MTKHKHTPSERPIKPWPVTPACYFPAIEGLAMLYGATKDDRYLKHAERMAEFFTKFDCLPVEHSHGICGSNATSRPATSSRSISRTRSSSKAGGS